MQLNNITSFLFTPGTHPERFHKAEEVGAGAIILDLEDSVPEKEKDEARENIIQYCQKSPKLFTIIRINHLTTLAGLKDILALQEADLQPDAIFYPKLESIAELQCLDQLLKCHQKGIAIIGLLETAKGLSQATNIISNSDYLSGLAFGAADYAADVACQLTWDALYLARLQTVQAAALKQLVALDSAYFNFGDSQALYAETVKVKELGFTGKMAIHPNQIEIIHQAFKPSEEEYQESSKIISIYEANAGKACQYNGKMIDIPVYKRALRTQQLAKNFFK